MGIGILIIVIGSLLYKGKNKIQKVLSKYRNRNKMTIKMSEKMQE